MHRSDVGRPRPHGAEPSAEESDAALKVLRRAAEDSTLRLDGEPELALFGIFASAECGKSHASSARLHKL
eukprot:COSAG02_NODE_381_length_23450_cov_65.782493_11_plen_70_part_00